MSAQPNLAADIRHPGPARPELGGYRDILVHVEPTGLATRRLETAIELARRFQAELIGLGAEAAEPSFGEGIAALIGGELAVAAQTVVIDDLCNAASLFRAKTSDLVTRWIAMQTSPETAVAEFARSADLIVAGGAAQPSERRAAEVGETVLQAGRPVLIAPTHGRPFRGRAAVVAWKDRREARRAVADALPLLRLAEVVVVAEVCDAAEVYDAEDRVGAVADYLHRHGIEAVGRAVASSGNPADEVKRAAHALGADLVVCGAFGRSRLGERTFGGFTHDMLRQPEQFVLMSH